MKLKTILHLGLPLLIVGATILACVTAPQPSTTDTAGVILDEEGNPFLPAELAGYHSKASEVSKAEEDILPGDTRFAKRIYWDLGDPHKEEWMAGSIVLSGGERRSLHRPEVCLPGQGWTIKETRVIPVPLNGDPDFEVRDLKLVRQVEDKDQKDGVRKLHAHYMYWWVGKDLSTPYTWKRVILTSYDNIVRNINHRWAYPSVMSQVHQREGESLQDADGRTLDRLKALIKASVPEFQKSFAKK